MENPKYLAVMRQAAASFAGLGSELFRLADRLEADVRYNPQQKLYSLVRVSEVAAVQLRNLAARTAAQDRPRFYSEVCSALCVEIRETHDWIRIRVPGILPKRNQRDDRAFLVRPLRQALSEYLRENPMERFSKCAVCITHRYDASLGPLRVRDYDSIETRRYLDVIESMLLTDAGGLSCTVLQNSALGDSDATFFYLMLPESIPKWLEQAGK